MQKKDPYIGITDFTSADDVRSMLAVFRHYRKEESTRKLMVGIMMSYKSLHGLPSKWENVFPKKETLEQIFFCHSLLLNTLHYADYDGLEVLESLLEATRWGGANMDALQLDMTWPAPDVIKKFRQIHPSVQIVLQAGRIALDQVHNDPVLLRQKLAEYEEALDYVLLDRSVGRGIGMQAEALRPFVEELQKSAPHLGVAVAGGLGPKTMHLVEPLARDFPNLSWDAQGQLRPSGSALDPIDWELAGQYLKESLTLVNT